MQLGRSLSKRGGCSEDGCHRAVRGQAPDNQGGYCWFGGKGCKRGSPRRFLLSRLVDEAQLQQPRPKGLQPDAPHTNPSCQA